MRCNVQVRETVRLEVTDVGTAATKSAPLTVPSELLNRLQSAQFELNRVEQEVLRHLVQTGTATDEHRTRLEELSRKLLS